jgi:hypothetical protein
VSAARQVVLGLDLGTTSAKAVAFDPDGRACAEAEAAYPLLEPEHGHAEQDPQQVVDAALGALRNAAAAARDGGAEVAGIGVSTAMHALYGVGEDSRPVTPLITWADTRAADQAELLRREHPELHDRTGTPLHPMAPLPKLMWLREHDPETFAAVRRWGGLKELALDRLAREWAVDHSCASGTGLMGLDHLDWDTEALEIAGVEPGQLATLVALLLYLALPAALTIGPGWPLPAAESLLLAALVFAARSGREARRRREIAIGLVLVAALANLTSLGLVIHYLLAGGHARGADLLDGAVIVWTTNLLLFAVLYWELDRGGPRRPAGASAVIAPDLLFPQMTGVPGYRADVWLPAFTDYVFVAFTTATAFSPTDTMPLSGRAKILMMVETVISLLVVAVVAARAVNVL